MWPVMFGRSTIACTIARVSGSDTGNGHAPRWLEDAARERRPDLYLLLDIDLPWVPDPQRDRGHLRPEMHARFREAVEKSGTPFVLICGGGDERFTAAREAIDRLLVSADSS